MVEEYRVVRTKYKVKASETEANVRKNVKGEILSFSISPVISETVVGGKPFTHTEDKTPEHKIAEAKAKKEAENKE